METKVFGWRIKSLDDEGSFIGMASTYGGEPDLVGDTIRRGAFAKTIQQNGGKVPLLWQHRPDSPIGSATLSDQPNGLAVNGQLLLEDATARKAYMFLKSGVVRGLSIGFDSLKSVDRADGSGRELTEIRLWEVSCVTFPANLNAGVTSVKSLSGVLPLLSSLRPDDLEDADVADLRALDRHVKRLLPQQRDDGEALEQWRQIDEQLKRLL
jgi:HK97 family phage prohead protease